MPIPAHQITHEIEVMIPEDHRLTIDVPQTLRSGPAKLILISQPAQVGSQPPSNRGRLAALADELAKEPRSFHELSVEERRARLLKLRGAGRGLTSGSEAFAQRKHEGVELEDRHPKPRPPARESGVR